MLALQQKLALIAFHHLNGHHTGKCLADVFIHLLDRVGVTEEVSMRAYHLLPINIGLLKDRALHDGWREQQWVNVRAPQDPTHETWHTDSL